MTTSSINDQTEWLEADGLGGFASGTASGLRTRRYHALLLVATTPPTGRMALVNGLVERMGARVSGRNVSDGGFEVELTFRPVA